MERGTAAAGAGRQARPLARSLEARRLFWLGFSLNNKVASRSTPTWERFIHSMPPGYYCWRAMERLKQILPSTYANPYPPQRLTPGVP